MRVVLIIQSLIILGGAYYVYTLTRLAPNESEGNNTAPLSAVQIQVEPKAESGEQTSDSGPESTAGEIVVTEGHNDLGMEFPVPDDGVLEVR
jgi:hypothetical protein